MKKTIPLMLLPLLIISCGSVKITRSVNRVSEKEVKSRLGSYRVIVKDVSESYFKYLQALDRQSQMGDNKTSAELQSLKYAINQYYLFEIRHVKVYPVKKWNFSLSVSDAKGNNQVEKLFYFEKLFSDKVVGEAWIIKTKKPVTSKIYPKKELPFRLNIKFLGQELEYSLNPKQ